MAGTSLEMGCHLALARKRLCYLVAYGDRDGPQSLMVERLVRECCSEGTVLAWMGSCSARSLYGMVHPDEDVDLYSAVSSFPSLFTPIFPRKEESVHASLVATLVWFQHGVVQPSMLELVSTGELDPFSSLDLCSELESMVGLDHDHPWQDHEAA